MDIYILFNFWDELPGWLRWFLMANVVMVVVRFACHLWVLVYIHLTWTEPDPFHKDYRPRRPRNSKPPAFASKRSKGK